MVDGGLSAQTWNRPDRINGGDHCFDFRELSEREEQDAAASSVPEEAPRPHTEVTGGLGTDAESLGEWRMTCKDSVACDMNVGTRASTKPGTSEIQRVDDTLQREAMDTSCQLPCDLEVRSPPRDAPFAGQVVDEDEVTPGSGRGWHGGPNEEDAASTEAIKSSPAEQPVPESLPAVLSALEAETVMGNFQSTQDGVAGMPDKGRQEMSGAVKHSSMRQAITGNSLSAGGGLDGAVKPAGELAMQQALAAERLCVGSVGAMPPQALALRARLLKDVLQEARPGWTQQDVLAVQRKLARLGIGSAGALAELLEEGQLNERLRGAGFKRFSVETLEALKHSLGVAPGNHATRVDLQDLSTVVSVPDFQRPVTLNSEGPLLSSDLCGTPRGKCLACSACPTCVLTDRSYVRWRSGADGDSSSSSQEEVSGVAEQYAVGDRVEMRNGTSEPWRSGTVASAEPVTVRPDGSGDGVEGSVWRMVRREGTGEGRGRDSSRCCERCGCAVSLHEGLHDWHSRVRTTMHRLRATGKNTSLKVPRRFAVPTVALEWEPTDVAFFVLTGGIFDPRCDGRLRSSGQSDVGLNVEPATGNAPVAAPDGEGGRLLVSVVTPTSAARHDFHPLLYECFRSQAYEPKELVVVDTGTKPSEFLQERARADPRVVYRFWPVQDARMQDLSDCVWDGGRGGVHRHWPTGGSHVPEALASLPEAMAKGACRAEANTALVTMALDPQAQRSEVGRGQATGAVAGQGAWW